MESFIKHFAALIIMVVITSCIDEASHEPYDNEVLSDRERRITGNYRYGSITANGDGPTLMADFNMEPLYVKTSLRQELPRREIQYNRSRNYQLQWTDRGEYQLGTDGDKNWQPNFGYWHITLDGDSLIHNAGQPYETRYRLYTTEDGFVRVHVRYMSEDGPSWSAGDEVVFAEHFIRIGY